MLRDGRTEVVIVIVYLTAQQRKHGGRIIAHTLAATGTDTALDN